MEAVSKGVLVHRAIRKREKKLQIDSDPNTFFEDAERLSRRFFLVSGSLIKAEMKKAKACKSLVDSVQLESAVQARIQKQLIHQLMKGLESKIPGFLAMVDEMKDGEFSPLELSPKQDKVKKAVLTERDIKKFGSRRCESCCKMIEALEPVVYAVQDAKNRIWHTACAKPKKPGEAKPKAKWRTFAIQERHEIARGVQFCRICQGQMPIGTTVAYKVGETPAHLACQESEDSTGPEAPDDDDNDWLAK